MNMDIESPELRGKVVFAQNTGKCMEDEYGEGAILLNLGCGDIAWPGWIGCDSNPDGWKTKRKPDVLCDITRLPFEGGYADAIAAIHVIEHFYKWEVQAVLMHWRHILKPGGKLILELPDLHKVFKYIANCMDQRIPLSPTFSLLPLYGDPAFGEPAMNHKWGYFSHTLAQELVKAGFHSVKAHKARYHFVERDMRVEALK